MVRAFTTPLAVPTSTVLEPCIGPKYLPCSNRESRGPNRRLDGCRGIHHTRSPNCAKGGTARLPTVLSYAVLPSRPTENLRCTRVAYDSSHVNKPWSAGTSSPQVDSTANLTDLTCPLTTVTEISAAPLDCGSPSADVSCTTSPLQAHSIQSAHHSSSRPDCISTADVPSFALRTAGSAIPFVSDLCGVDVQ